MATSCSICPNYVPLLSKQQPWERPVPINPDIEKMGLLMEYFRQSFASQDWSKPNQAAARALGEKFNPKRDSDLAKALALVNWHDPHDVKNAMVMVEMWRVLDLSVNYRTVLERIRKETGHDGEMNDLTESLTVSGLLLFVAGAFRRVMNRIYHVPIPFALMVNRTNVFQSSIIQIMDAPPFKLVRGLRVQFIDEEGEDAGGLTREFLSLISRDIFSPSRQLFAPLDDGTMYFHPQNIHSIDNTIYLYRFVGRMMGFCFKYQLPMDVDLNSALYKLIFSPEHVFDLEDLKLFDMDVYRSMNYILEHTVEPGMFYFESSRGESISDSISTMVEVTESNKQLYVSLMVNDIIKRRFRLQAIALALGFREIAQKFPDSLNVIKSRLGGKTLLNVEEWYSQTEWQFRDNSTQLQWHFKHLFKELLFRWNQDPAQINLRNMLMFATGSRRLPFSGFAGLSTKFKVVQLCNSTLIPSARTCFNQLEIPTYNSVDILEEKMLISINSDAGFGFL